MGGHWLYALHLLLLAQITPTPADAAYGYINQRMTLHCPGYKGASTGTIIRLTWKKCLAENGENDCSDVGSMMILGQTPSTRMKGDLEERGEMSAPLGELTIYRLQFGDEATYRCEFSNHLPQNINLSVYEPPSDPEIIGVNEPIIVGKQPEVICRVERAKPSNLTIRWNIAGDHRVLNAKLSVTPADGDGVVSAHSVLLYNFTRDDDRRNLQCDVIPGVDQALNTRTTEEVLNLEYPFITRVQETSSSTWPLEGHSKMLTCHQVSPGNPNHVDGYIWLHNDVEIDGSNDNYSGTDAKRMEIKILDRNAHNGHYQCLIRNEAGDTKMADAEGYDLNVWYAPEVTFDDILPTNRVIDNTEVTLTCHADSVPAGKNFTWLRENIVVRGPTESEYNSIYHRRVSHTDGGNYTCRVCNAVMCVSRTKHLEVFFPPSGSPGLVAAPPRQVIGGNVTLTCYSSDLTVRGNPFPTWTVWSKDSNRTFSLNKTGVTFTFTASSVLESGGYRCAMGNQYSYGNPTDLSRSEQVEIVTPLVPEAPTSSSYDEPPYNSDFSLTCKFSGSNIRTIVWMKDNVEVDHLLFDIDQRNMDGHYSYDQTVALRSTLRRRPLDQYSCLNVAAFSGSFHCVAQSDSAGEVSPTMEVHAKYPPFWNGHPTMIESSQTGDHNKEVRCNVCAYPAVSQVTWTDTYGGTLRHGITISNDTIVIDTVRIEDFTVYRCQVQNELSAKEFEITLEEKGPPHQVTELTILNVTSTVVTLTWTQGYHAGFPPLTFSIRYRLRDVLSAEWKYIENIPENPSGRTLMWEVAHLTPNSNYTFQVQAHNMRPPFEGPNTSMWVSRDTRTNQPLNVTVDRVSVTDNGRLEIIWKWNENRRRKRSRGAEEVGIHMKSSVAGDVSKRAKRSVALDDVSVRANYSTDGGLIWSLYPEDRGVPVREGRMMVHGEFKRDMDVLVKLVVYEFGVLAVVVDAPEHVYGKPVEGLNPVMIGAVVGAIVVVLLLLILLSLMLMRRRQGKPKEGDVRRNGHAAPIMQRPGNQYERVQEDSSAENSQNDMQDVHYEPMRTCHHACPHIPVDPHIPMEAKHALYAKPCKIHQRRPPEHHYHEIQAPSIPERGYQCEHHHEIPFRDSGYEMEMENPYAEVNDHYQKLRTPYTEIKDTSTLKNPHTVDGRNTLSPPMMRPMSKPPSGTVENYTYAEVKKPPRLLQRGEADGASGDQLKESGNAPKQDYTYAEVKKPKKQGPPKPKRTFAAKVIQEDIPPSDTEDPPTENLYAEIDTKEIDKPPENPYSNLPPNLPPENPYANMPDPHGNPPECPYGNMEEIEKQQFQKIMGEDGVLYADLDFRNHPEHRAVAQPAEKYDKTEYASIDFLAQKKAPMSVNNDESVV